MCIPGYWIAGFHGFHRPRKLQYPMGWGTLGFAVPGRARRLARRHRPDGLDLGRRRLPVRLRRAGDDGAGAAPVHRRDRRRRRLRDAALRPGAGRAGSRSASTSRRRTSPRWRELRLARRETVEGLDDAVRRGARAACRRPGPERARGEAEALVPPPTTSPNWYRKRALTLRASGVGCGVATWNVDSVRQRARRGCCRGWTSGSRTWYPAKRNGSERVRPTARRELARAGTRSPRTSATTAARPSPARCLDDALAAIISRAARCSASPRTPGSRGEAEAPARATAGRASASGPTTACSWLAACSDIGRRRCPAGERAVATVAPPPRARSSGSAACVPKTTPSRLTPIARPVEREVEVAVDSAAAAAARVQMDEVEPTAALDRERDRRAVRLEVGDVAGECVAADRRGDRARARRESMSARDDGRALLRKRGRGRPAVPPAAPVTSATLPASRLKPRPA